MYDLNETAQLIYENICGNTCFQVWNDVLKSEKHGKDFIIKDYSDLLTMDMVGKICFGFDFDSQKKNESKFVELLMDHVTNTRQLILRAVLDMIPFMMKIPFGPGYYLKRSNDEAKRGMNEVSAFNPLRTTGHW